MTASHRCRRPRPILVQPRLRPRAFLGEVGLATPAGEHGQPALAQLWARPTADINGIYGGYQGDGTKTVIPAEATAKLTFRLVPGQDPQAVVRNFERFVTERLRPDAKASFRHGGAAPGFAMDLDAPFMRAAQAALAAEFGRPAALIGCGASIPVVEAFKTHLGLDTLLAGFGLDDDRIHSPNEKFELACFPSRRPRPRQAAASLRQPNRRLVIPDGVLDLHDRAAADQRHVEPHRRPVPVRMLGQRRLRRLQQPLLLPRQHRISSLFQRGTRLHLQKDQRLGICHD